jgi:hypothetical protein
MLLAKMSFGEPADLLATVIDAAFPAVKVTRPPKPRCYASRIPVGRCRESPHRQLVTALAFRSKDSGRRRGGRRGLCFLDKT